MLLHKITIVKMDLYDIKTWIIVEVLKLEKESYNVLVKYQRYMNTLTTQDIWKNIEENTLYYIKPLW
jgi:hypothetical protein